MQLPRNEDWEGFESAQGQLSTLHSLYLVLIASLCALYGFHLGNRSLPSPVTQSIPIKTQDQTSYTSSEVSTCACTPPKSSITVDSGESITHFNLEEAFEADKERDGTLASLLENNRFTESFSDIEVIRSNPHETLYKAKHIFDGKLYFIRKFPLPCKTLSDLTANPQFQEVTQKIDSYSNHILQYCTCWIETQHSTDVQLFVQLEYFSQTTLKEVLENRYLTRKDGVWIFKQVLKGISTTRNTEMLLTDALLRKIYMSSDLHLKIGDFSLTELEEEPKPLRLKKLQVLVRLLVTVISKTTLEPVDTIQAFANEFPETAILIKKLLSSNIDVRQILQSETFEEWEKLFLGKKLI